MTQFDPAQPPDEVAETSALASAEVGVEQPEADTMEQVRPTGDERHDEMPDTIPWDADPADVIEQHRDVEAGEEDDR
nr:hypothetical protein [Kibdelosporangium sp. MJ126-NF4]CEL12987.1 hypothetical protein [Kibdelosporangium sp. MJ126-NF4]CTQ98673.1 hypothetical protein [Kibdelosporangium sp. MJ126-NF4]